MNTRPRRAQCQASPYPGTEAMSGAWRRSSLPSCVAMGLIPGFGMFGQNLESLPPLPKDHSQSAQDLVKESTLNLERGVHMRKLFLGSVALVAMGLGAPAAFAAERAVPAYAPPPPPPPAYTWTGCYVGASAGWGS